MLSIYVYGSIYSNKSRFVICSGELWWLSKICSASLKIKDGEEENISFLKGKVWLESRFWCYKMCTLF